MANTYTLISSNVLTGSAASVTFSSIPSTYTDLVLRYSLRSDAVSIGYFLYANLNSTTGIYSRTQLGVDSGTIFSDTASAQTNNAIGTTNGDGTTASTFGSGELYVPNYAGTLQKPMSGFSVIENNSATVYRIRTTAALGNITSAITSLTFSLSAGNFMTGSSFYLYGIKNA